MPPEVEDSQLSFKTQRSNDHFIAKREQQSKSASLQDYEILTTANVRLLSESDVSYVASLSDVTQTDEGEPNSRDMSEGAQVKSPGSAREPGPDHLSSEPVPIMHYFTGSNGEGVKSTNGEGESGSCRSESPETIEEIPFARGAKTRALELISGMNEDTQTIAVSQTASKVPKSYGPQGIFFLEGSKELQNFPILLHQQLRHECQTKQTNHPDFIKPKWPPPNSIHRTKTGKDAWFELPGGAGKLLSARYQYGQNSQIIVVQPEPAQSFNSGRPAVVLRDPNAPLIIHSDETRYLSQFSWTVWDPHRPDSTDQVWRIVDGVGPDENKSPEPVPLPLKPAALTPHLPKATPTEQAVRTDENGSPLVNRSRKVTQGLKRTAVSDLQSSRVKQPRPSKVEIQRHLLRGDYPVSGSLGVRRDVATGEILLRRKTDGKLVALRCPECDQRKCDTQHGLMLHMNSVHDMSLRNHHEMVAMCAVEVAETSNRETSQSTDSDAEDSPAPTVHSRTPTTATCDACRQRHRRCVGYPICKACTLRKLACRRTTRSPATNTRSNTNISPKFNVNTAPNTSTKSNIHTAPNTSTGSNFHTDAITSTESNINTNQHQTLKHSLTQNDSFPGSNGLRGSELANKESRFIYKLSANGPSLRVRPLSSINTAEKLYANAVAAGITKRDTLLLTITIEREKPVYVVKNDKEDFDRIVSDVERGSFLNPDIVVTVEDLD